MFTAPTIFVTSLMTKILKFTCKFVILVYYQSLFNKYWWHLPFTQYQRHFYHYILCGTHYTAIVHVFYYEAQF